MPIEELKEAILKKINTAAKTACGQVPESLEIGFPPNTDMGHFAVGCFSLAKQFRRSPAEIATNIVSRIQPDDLIAEVSAAGPYINLKIEGGTDTEPNSNDHVRHLRARRQRWRRSKRTCRP